LSPTIQSSIIDEDEDDEEEDEAPIEEDDHHQEGMDELFHTGDHMVPGNDQPPPPTW